MKRKKLTKVGEILFEAIESIALAMIGIGIFKYHILSLAGLGIFITNSIFLSNSI